MEELSNCTNGLRVEWSAGGIVPENVGTEVTHLSSREVMKIDTLCNASEIQSECFHKALGKGRLQRRKDIKYSQTTFFFFFIIPMRLCPLRKLSSVNSMCT